MFYFRSRGKVMNSGRLYNAADDQCFNVDVDGVSCDSDHPKQFWTQYENGEILSNYNHTCLDVEGLTGSGDVKTYNC